tara:strand:- start:3106 stop:3303 length:198 start_codon:yes stop_codon:yes gene_type:complete
MNTVEKTINVSTWEQAAEQTAVISSRDNIVGNVSFQWDKIQEMYVIRWIEEEVNKVGFLRTKKYK